MGMSFRRKASRWRRDVCIWRSYVGKGKRATLANRTLLFWSSCRTVLDPPLTRAPACHLVRECFRFRRPKGNNPSFRPLDHVEDRVSFVEYYRFLYSDMYVCRVHSYICITCNECTCVSLAPSRCKAGAVSGSHTAHQRQRASALLSEIAATKCTKLYRSAQSCASWACLRRFRILG